MLNYIIIYTLLFLQQHSFLNHPRQSSFCVIYTQSLELLEQWERELLHSGIADGTKSNYNGHYTRFVRFCVLYGFSALPTSEKVLQKYAAFRFHTTTNIGDSFKNELYGIKDAHTNAGYNLDVSMNAMPTLGKIRNGWKRKRMGGIRKRDPITSDILKRFLLILNNGSRDHQTLRGMLCLA